MGFCPADKGAGKGKGKKGREGRDEGVDCGRVGDGPAVCRGEGGERTRRVEIGLRKQLLKALKSFKVRSGMLMLIEVDSRLIIQDFSAITFCPNLSTQETSSVTLAQTTAILAATPEDATHAIAV